MKISKQVIALCMLMLTVFASEVRVSSAVTCSPVELAPCYGAMTSNQAPTSACCDELRQQKPCLCGYLKDPNLRPYINSPNARKVSATCGVPFPPAEGFRV